MKSAKTEFVPNYIFKKQFYLNLAILPFTVLMLIFSHGGSLNDEIIHWILFACSIAFLFSIFLSLYSDMQGGPYHPIFIIQKGKVDLIYPRIDNTKITIAKKDITEVSGYFFRKVPTIGIKFRDYKKFAEMDLMKSGRRNIVSIISIYFVLMKHHVPIKLSQFFSDSLEDRRYINLAILRINEKTTGYHLGFLQAYYAPRKFEDRYKNFLFRESKELLVNLKRELSDYNEKEIPMSEAKQPKLILINRKERSYVRYLFYSLFIIIVTYAAYIDISPQEHLIGGIIFFGIISLILVGCIEGVYQFMKFLRKKYYW